MVNQTAISTNDNGAVSVKKVAECQVDTSPVPSLVTEKVCLLVVF
jgi:hypothetical protein